jgi:predicted TIM-barrel fold metal-dependent hydrolase
VVEPAPFRFVDIQIHFWDHSVPGLRWAFLEDEWEHPRLGDLPTLDAPRFGVDELRAEVAGLGVEKVVHTQAAAPECDPVVETAWLQSLGDESGWPTAIVAVCDMAGDRAADDLERHAAHSRFRGVRDLVIDPNVGPQMGVPEFDRGMKALTALGGSLEVMVSWPLFDDVLSVARRHPDATIVLGHAGVPIERTDAYFADWSAALRRVAAAENVVCKVSALASGADPHWTVESIRRWVLGCIDAFGPQRCMFASNWPVDKLFGTYSGLLRAYQQIVADFSVDEQAGLFAANAERVYRI